MAAWGLDQDELQLASNGSGHAHEDDVALDVPPTGLGIASNASTLSSTSMTPLSPSPPAGRSERRTAPSNSHKPGARERVSRHGPAKSRLLLASFLVQAAQQGVGFFGKEDDRSLLLYQHYTSWPARYTLYAFVLLNLMLPVFENPNGSLDMLWPVAALTTVEALCLLVFSGRLLHMWRVWQPSKFWKDRKNIGLMCTIALTALDLIVWNAVRASGGKSIRFSRVLRPLFLCMFSDFYQVRRGFRNIRRTATGVLNVMVLLFLWIALFALLLVKLFRSRDIVDQSGGQYMRSWPDAFFDLYVLMTSANFPDIMMPGYNRSRWYALAFILFVVTAMFIFLSIVLASVYNSYRQGLEAEVLERALDSRHDLNRAFELLSADGRRLSKSTWSELAHSVDKEFFPGKLEPMWQILDPEGCGSIDSQAFGKTAEILYLGRGIVRTDSWLLRNACFNCYNSAWSEQFKFAVKHRFFQYTFNVIIVLNAIFIASNEDRLDVAFLVLFNLELGCKLYAYGHNAFFRSRWNWFDFAIIAVATILEIYFAINREINRDRGILDFVLVLRIFRLLKVIGNIDRFKKIISTVFQLGPAISTYGVMLFLVYYAFAIIGLELFHGRIYEGNSDLPGSLFEPGTPYYEDLHRGNRRLEGTDFALDGYYKNNFNDIVSAFILLFELTVVNQWHVLAGGFVTLTGRAARLYFVAFHLVAVILVVNIFIAFILEGFLLQGEEEIDLEQELTRELREKLSGTELIIVPRVRNAERIYQRMFRDELLKRLDEQYRPTAVEQADLDGYNEGSAP